MVGIYLSGTGNTKYCIEKLVSLIHSSAKAIPMESPEAISAIQQNEEIYIGYPTQFSNAPYMVRDFIKKNADIWKNKKILCIATMGAFSGDGAGCTTRMLKRYGATILGGIHIHMPDSVCDSKLLKKTMDENRCIIAQADRKIEEVALQIINGDYPQEGITLVSHIIGLLGQRLWFILADEPTGNLDSKTSMDVILLMQSISRQFHQTTIMITHNEEIAQMADRTIRIEDGKVVSGGVRYAR